jgi:hypothetical protein
MPEDVAEHHAIAANGVRGRYSVLDRLEVAAAIPLILDFVDILARAIDPIRVAPANELLDASFRDIVDAVLSEERN